MSYKPISASTLDDLLLRKEFYGLMHEPKEDVDQSIEDLLSKKLTIRSHQLFVSNLIAPETPYKRIHLWHGTGTGKCLAKDTPVLTHAGDIVKVQDVRPGDVLMGDDSNGRIVTSTTTGTEIMYRVKTSYSSFSCNESHILTLWDRRSRRVVDVPLTEVTNCENYRAIQAVIRFPERQTPLGPREFGLWLSSPIFDIPFCLIPNKPNEESTKRVPPIYKINSYARRVELIQGLLAGKHIVYRSGSWYFYHSNRDLIADLAFIARSVGYLAMIDETISLIGESRYILIITGHHGSSFPFPPHHKKLHLRMAIEKLGEGQYYGFTIDKNCRFVLGNLLVTHNTLAATAIASKFIRVYSELYTQMAAKSQSAKRSYVEMDRSTPTVYVLGFEGTKSAFVRDLLKYPEFGFITAAERDELLKRQKLASSGFPEDVKFYKDYQSGLKRRITNKSRGGFFKFYGYDEFVNRLFKTSKIKLIDLEAEVISRLRAGEQVTLEGIVDAQIENGNIQVNKAMLSRFENSLLICDEIHNTYNMNMKNNRGIAIQYVLDTVENLRFVSMSATPINNTPSECIELINYLLPKDQKVTKRQFFSGSKNISQTKIDELAALTMGKVSFLQDSNIK